MVQNVFRIRRDRAVLSKKSLYFFLYIGGDVYLNQINESAMTVKMAIYNKLTVRSQYDDPIEAEEIMNEKKVIQALSPLKRKMYLRKLKEAICKKSFTAIAEKEQA